MLFADYLAQWTASVPAPAEAFRYGTVVEDGRSFDLVGLRSPGAPLVLITAGFHGDEKAGPLTLLAHTAEIVEYAAARGVGLAIYPCVNPSGFEAHIRYNLSGERPNNDFLRSEVSPARAKGSCASSLRSTASPRRRPLSPASSIGCRSRRRRWICTRTTSSTAISSTPTCSAILAPTGR